MAPAKFNLGQMVRWKGQRYKIEKVSSYQDFCWVYDFEKHPFLPLHFTSIPEKEIRLDKPWWRFW